MFPPICLTRKVESGFAVYGHHIRILRRATGTGGGSQYGDVQPGEDAECLPSGAHHCDPRALKEGLQRAPLLRKQVCTHPLPRTFSTGPRSRIIDPPFKLPEILYTLAWGRR